MVLKVTFLRTIVLSTIVCLGAAGSPEPFDLPATVFIRDVEPLESSVAGSIIKDVLCRR